jgi:tetratricopeptide (TPR) repeat protein
LAILGLVSLSQGKARAARALLKRAVAGDSTNAEAHFWLGVAALRAGTPTQALPAFEAAISLRSDRPEYRLARSLALAAAKRPGAQEDLVAAARLRPNLLEPTYHPDERRGMVRILERSLRGYPARGEVTDTLGRLLFDAGLFREAEAQLKGRQSGPALEIRGRLALDRGEVDRAARLLDKAASASPSSSQTLFSLGRALFLQGQRTRALDIFKAAARLEPADDRVQRAIGWLHLHQGNLEKAELAFEYARGQKRTPDALLGLGRVLELRSDLEGARRRYEEAEAMAPSVESLERLAGVLDRLGEETRSVRRRLRQANRLDKEFSRLVHDANKANAEHAAWCKELSSTKGRSSKPGGNVARRFALAGTLARAGQLEQARAHGSAVLRRMPARRWSAGARPILVLRRKIGTSFMVRAALLDYVVLGR